MCSYVHPGGWGLNIDLMTSINFRRLQKSATQILDNTILLGCGIDTQ